MRKILSLVLVLVMSISIISGCTPKVENNGGAGESNEKIVMKIAHPAMPGSPRDLGANKIKEVIERETDGRVEVQVYPSQQLGLTNEIIQGLQNGNIEMNMAPVMVYGTVQPLVGVLDIPFLYPDTNEDMISFLASDAVKPLMETTKSKDIVTLDLWFAGLKNFTANKPLETIADFKGQKFRVMPAPMLVEQFKALGASGLNIDLGETYSSLQTGAIDGQENPYDVIFEQKYHEVQKYVTQTSHASVVLAIAVSQKWWNDLPADIQEAVLKGIEEGKKVATEKLLENEANYKEQIRASGVGIVELTKEDKEAFAPVREHTIEAFKEKYGEEGKSIFELLSEEAKKYSK